MSNINVIDINWDMFKSTEKGKRLDKAKEIYTELYTIAINNGHKILSEFTKNTEKILIDFNCGHDPHWTIPKTYRKGHGCPKCSGQCPEDAKQRFFDMLYSNNHSLLSEYISSSEKILIDFNCGHEPHWTTPRIYRKGHRCPKCTGHCSEQAKEDLLEMVKNNNHKLLSEYIDSTTKILIDFNCGHEPHWVKPSLYKSGNRCPKCTGHCSEQAKERFFDALYGNNHKLLSEYIDTKTKVLIDFGCEHEPSWVVPNHYKYGYNKCPQCYGQLSEKAKENFINMIENNNHKLLSEYIDTKTKVLIDFGCEHEPSWVVPNQYKYFSNCPKCRNKGESELYKLLLSLNYELDTQKKYDDLKDKYYLPYDAYLPQYNLLIELDGIHHYQPVAYYSKDMSQYEKDMAELDAELRFYDRQRKDKMKDDYAKKNNISLLRIDYSDSIINTEKWKQLILDKIEEIKTSSNTYKYKEI